MLPAAHHAAAISLSMLLRIAAAASRQPGTPNIIFLMSDQHRWDSLSPKVSTPSLDILARSGVKFRNHYASVPSCPGARASIVTGLSPWKHGMVGFGKIAPQYQHDLPAEVANLGYKTISIGKNHFGWNNTENMGVSHGYQVREIYDGALGIVDDYEKWFRKVRPGEYSMKSGGLSYNSFEGAIFEFEEFLHPTAWTGDRAVKMIEKLAEDPDTPFLLKVSFHRPHPPYDPPQRLFDQTPEPEDEPVVSKDGWDEVFKNCTFGGDYPWCGEVSDEVSKRGRRAYRASIAFVDEQVGLILEALKENGLDDNTFILFSADHGDMQLDHFLRLKQYAYEGSSHIPMIVRWPTTMDSLVTIPRGSELDDVTELRDIFPTFMDVAGAWNDEWEGIVDGRPLTWLFTETVQPRSWRKWIDLQHNAGFAAEVISWNGLTNGKEKYIYHAKTGQEQFFDLASDPYETVDLARDPANEERVAEWRARLAADFEAEQRGPDWSKNGELTIRPGNCLYTQNFPLGASCPQGVHTNSLLAKQATILRGARRHVGDRLDDDVSWDPTFD